MTNSIVIDLPSSVRRRRSKLNRDRYVARVTGRTAARFNDVAFVLAHLCDVYTIGNCNSWLVVMLAVPNVIIMFVCRVLVRARVQYPWRQRRYFRSSSIHLAPGVRRKIYDDDWTRASCVLITKLHFTELSPSHKRTP